VTDVQTDRQTDGMRRLMQPLGGSYMVTSERTELHFYDALLSSCVCRIRAPACVSVSEMKRRRYIGS